MENSTPLYCYWREEARDHFYSTVFGIGITKNIVPRIVGFCPMKPFMPHIPNYNIVPLRQYYNPKTDDHCYKTKERDADLERQGYTDERLICYVYIKE